MRADRPRPTRGHAGLADGRAAGKKLGSWCIGTIDHVGAGPGVVEHPHAVAVQVDLEEPRQAQPGRVAEQRRAGVEAELVGHVGGRERPGGVDVPAAIKVRADPRQPVAGPRPRSSSAWRPARRCRPAGPPPGNGRRRSVAAGGPRGRPPAPGPAQLLGGQAAPRRDVRPGRVEAEDRRLVVDRPEPRVRPGGAKTPNSSSNCR